MNQATAPDSSTQSLDIGPEQASILAVIAQGAEAGQTLEEYGSLVAQLEGDSLAVAQLLISGDKSSAVANRAVMTVTAELRRWAKELRVINTTAIRSGRKRAG